MDDLLVSFYYATLPLPTPTYPPVLNSVFVLISFPYCVSYIPWCPLSMLVHRLSISAYIFRSHSLLLLLYAVIIRFLSFPFYLFMDMCRGVSRLLTPCINFPILTSSLPNITKNT